jgi:sugar phosphate isomerase/epimerase
MKLPFPIAVSTGTFFPLPTLQSIEQFKELGIQDVELTLQQSEFSLTFERKLSMPILPELSALVQSGELHIRSVHAPSNHMHCYNLWARREFLIHSLEVCRCLGGKLVVIHPYHLFRTHEDALDYLDGKDTLSPSALVPGIDELLDRAHSAGIRFALENIQDWADEVFFNVPQSIAQFLQDINHPALGFTLDLLHAEVAGSLDEFVRSLSAEILNIHASDLLLPPKRVPIGKGVIKWEQLVPRLQALPNLCQITVELQNPQPGELIESIELLSKY